jgi:hypothetical protein
LGLSEITDKIRSKGHWVVAIRPEPFDENRVDYAELDEILAGAAVRFRGWPVPFIDNRQELMHGDSWIGQDVDAELVSHHEAWRFFASGQFNHLRTVSADWREGREATPTPAGFASVIEVWEILFYLTEVFELATRLALGPAGGEQTTIDIRLNGLQDRGLVVANHNRAEFMTPYRSSTDFLQRSMTVPRDELVAEGRSRAVDMARDFFLRFGWKPTLDLLSDYQRELTERS